MNSVQKGQRALNLANDEIFQMAIQDLSKELMKKWEMSRNTEDRENVWYEVKAIERIANKLTAYVQDGQMDERTRT